MTELDTGNLTFIVESVFKELDSAGVVGVKKNAIERRVREVCEKGKSGTKKVWKVREVGGD